jgi:hypothetical protein
MNRDVHELFEYLTIELDIPCRWERQFENATHHGDESEFAMSHVLSSRDPLFIFQEPCSVQVYELSHSHRKM